MGFTHPVLARALAALATAALAGSLLLVADAPPAAADTVPTTPGTPETVSSDALPTVQINGVVWSQAIVGDVVYAGGSFTSAQPAGAAAGVNTVPRSNLLAYNIRTGALITSFAPTVNGQVKSVSASPDGSRVYIGGGFTQVNGVNRYRVAAFDTATGALSSWAPAFNSTVETVAATESTVYVGGNFTAVGSTARNRVAAVRASNGAVLPFTATPDGGRVRAIVISPDRSKIVVGGNFTTLNGSSQPGYGIGALDATTGALLPWASNDIIRNGGEDASIYSLTSDGDSVYGSGYHFGGGGTLEGTFRADWNDGTLVWVQDCHGDTYSVAATSEVVYTASHAHYCGNVGGFPQTSPTWTIQRAMAWSKAPTDRTATADPYGYYSFTGQTIPELLNWWPDINVGTFTGATQGAWNVTANEEYVLYGGEFTQVNNKRQQGLVRFAVKDIAPNDDGPRLGGANYTPTAISLATGTARLSWLANYDRDNEFLTYELIRDGNTASPVYTTVEGSRIWYDRPQMGYLDTGLIPGRTYSYRLRVTDPMGNVANSATVSVTAAASGALSDYAEQVLDDGAGTYLRLGDAAGSTTAVDWAGFGDATPNGGVAFGAAGAIDGDGNTAATFDGAGAFIASRSPIPGPDTFAVEAWFRTTSTSGGKIVGFGNSATGNSSSYDRHVFMDGEGRVFFGVYPGQERRVQSTPGFNDGQWHHVVANLGPSGMQLYLDGRRVGARTDTTGGQPYSGYWRVGGDRSWSGADYFTGQIDDVAIYPQPLSLQTVNEHFALAGFESTVPAAPADPYGARVYSDSPDFYWRLDDSGSTAADSGVFGATGQYSGGVTRQVAGAIAGTTDRAARFDGSSGLVATTNPINDPRVYSIELWFSSTTDRGGKLAGFGSSNSGTSGNYDRHVYLQDDGRLVFGTWTGVANTITTAESLTDGAWHHVVATQSAQGMRLYIDGALAGTHPQTGAQPYGGYWRIGGDTTWGSSSPWVAATIDEVAIYDRALDADAVAAHHALGSGEVPNSAPTAAFTVATTDRTIAVDASTSSDPDGTLAAYSWDFGDGFSVAGPTAEHTYAAPGDYTVRLTVTDDDGATATATRAVTATVPNLAPTAAFTATTTGLGVTFDSSASADSDGSISNRSWDFGDGATSALANPTHTYAASGTYPVKLVVTDDDGATAELVQEVTVLAPNVAPTASFTATPSGLSVHVDASGSTDPDGTVSSFAWSFGDGASATGAVADHTYAAAGTYTVTLTVTDDDGATATTTRSATVVAPGTPAPLAADGFSRSVTGGLGAAETGGVWTTTGSAANYSVSSGAARLRTAAGATLNGYLTSVASVDTDVRATVVLTSPSTGGGVFTSLIGRRVGTADYRARVVVNSAGQVNLQLQRNGVTLQAVRVEGLAANSSEALRVALQVVGTSPTTLRAKVWNAAAAEPSGWQLTATDSTAGLQTAGHVGVGTYLASSATAPITVAIDDLRATASTTGPVTPPVNAAPTAAFTATTSALTASVDASASTDSDGSIASFAWAFGDGGTATGPTAQRTYAAPGTYTVTLTVTDDDGATATRTQPVTVAAAPVPGVLAADAFGRTVSNGWGAADAGGAWTGSGAASAYSVDGATGRIRSAAAGHLAEARLASVSSTSADVTVSTSLDAPATGGGVYVSVVGRSVGSSDYRARLVIAANGGVTLQLRQTATTLQAIKVPGLVYAPGEVLRVRLQVTGTAPTTLRAKVWRAGAAEPAEWLATATDSTAALQTAGAIGLGTYITGSATTLPVVTSFDDLAVAVVQ